MYQQAPEINIANRRGSIGTNTYRNPIEKQALKSLSNISTTTVRQKNGPNTCLARPLVDQNLS